MDSNRCIEYKGASIAGNKMQLSILNGLKREFNDSLDVVSILPIAPFPQTKKILVKYQRQYISNEIQTTLTSFINIPYIKQITQIANSVDRKSVV